MALALAAPSESSTGITIDHSIDVVLLPNCAVSIHRSFMSHICPEEEEVVGSLLPSRGHHIQKPPFEHLFFNYISKYTRFQCHERKPCSARKLATPSLPIASALMRACLQNHPTSPPSPCLLLEPPERPGGRPERSIYMNMSV